MALRFGLIGCGPMGRELAKSVQQIPEAKVVVVADPVEEARQQAMQDSDVPGLADAAEVLARREVEAVIIATPNYLHKEHTLAAAAAGKHIFCEKPMALSVADCDEMIAAADRAGVKLMVGQVLRLLFPFARVAELARESELGAPVAVDITRVGPWRPRVGWRARRDQSGGLLFELNVHEIDFMRHLCGEVAEVSAVGGNYLHPDLDYPDHYFITLRFRSGAVGRLRAGSVSLKGKYEGEVVCPRGTVWFLRDTGTTTLYRPGAEPEAIEQSQWDKPGGYVWELASFTDWVLHGTAPVFTAQDGRAAIQLAEAAERSLAEGKPVLL